MSAQTNPIKSTRSVARGYTKPSYVCFDCGEATKNVQLVYRDFYGDGSRSEALVHRTGSGCHKNDSAYDLTPPVK